MNEMKAPLLKTQYQGIWFDLHLRSYIAKDLRQQKNFIKYLRETIKYLPCEKCSKHALNYISTNPPRVGTSIDHSGVPNMFVYMFEFHNYVNRRLGKSLADFQNVYEYYDNLVRTRDSKSAGYGPECRGCV